MSFTFVPKCKSWNARSWSDKKTYIKRPKFALAAKLLLALAFVPKNRESATFESVVRKLFGVSDSIEEGGSKKEEDLCTYFKNTCMEICTILQRPTQIHIEVSSQEKTATEGRATTNNTVKVRHWRIKIFFNGSLSSIWGLQEN